MPERAIRYLYFDKLNQILDPKTHQRNLPKLIFPLPLDDHVFRLFQVIFSWAGYQYHFLLFHEIGRQGSNTNDSRLEPIRY